MKAIFLFTFLMVAGIGNRLFSQTMNAYKIYDVAHRREIKAADIPALCQGKDIIFWGEEHNDSIGHALELQIFSGLYQQNKQVALSLEMFETDVQETLNEYLAGLIREDYLNKDARSWPNYKTDYRPLVEFAKSNKLAVIAANAPKRYVSAVTKNGLDILRQFNDKARSYLAPLPILVAEGAYYEKFSAIMGGHEAMVGSHIFESQNLWDATMAWTLYRYKKQYPAITLFHINGGFHSDDKLGAYAQLLHYAQKDNQALKLFNISCSADSSWENPDWEKLKNRGDIIILTRPQQPDKES